MLLKLQQSPYDQTKNLYWVLPLQPSAWEDLNLKKKNLMRKIENHVIINISKWCKSSFTKIELFST